VRWILTVLALGELMTDQLPSTPSRTVPVQFAGRIVTSALSGAAIGASSGSLIVGTLGGHAARAKLAIAVGKDMTAVLIEDAAAILAAVVIVKVALWEGASRGVCDPIRLGLDYLSRSVED
jgi:uncharacterized membrane protein